MQCYFHFKSGKVPVDFLVNVTLCKWHCSSIYLNLFQSHASSCNVQCTLFLNSWIVWACSICKMLYVIFLFCTGLIKDWKLSLLNTSLLGPCHDRDGTSWYWVSVMCCCGYSYLSVIFFMYLSELWNTICIWVSIHDDNGMRYI